MMISAGLQPRFISSPGELMISGHSHVVGRVYRTDELTPASLHIYITFHAIFTIPTHYCFLREYASSSGYRLYMIRRTAAAITAYRPLHFIISS